MIIQYVSSRMLESLWHLMIEFLWANQIEYQNPDQKPHKESGEKNEETVDKQFFPQPLYTIPGALKYWKEVSPTIVYLAKRVKQRWNVTRHPVLVGYLTSVTKLTPRF